MSAEIGKMALSGHTVVGGQYITSVPVCYEIPDEKTGKIKRYPKLRHRMVGATDVFTIDEVLPETTDPETVAIPFKRGQTLWCIVEKMVVEKGNVVMRGTPQPVAQ